MGYRTYFTLRVEGKKYGINDAKVNEALEYLTAKAVEIGRDDAVAKIDEIGTVFSSHDINPIEDLRKENDNAMFALEDDGSSSDECKWYDYTEDMTAFSKKYPNHIFFLRGEGESPGDVWREEYRNGAMVERKQAVIDF